jgi:hypothetical protein
MSITVSYMRGPIVMVLYLPELFALIMLTMRWRGALVVTHAIRSFQ